ncbi:hypothetical protein HRI_004139200 [Hibiscus trionum]|uniref:Retrotransposon gag domain-containing protein n=1 Tax=Hibiscus trionum TaxID=183268 RepID=A0A9W7IY59_HIBTR|nr:hypothetical protein HRI_004139200 [Hibiscus trionum]
MGDTENSYETEILQITQNHNQGISQASTDSSYATWELNNSMVMAWLINSMEGHISRTYLFFKTAKETWDAIKENYSDLGNASQVFEIKLKLKDIRQGTLKVTQYYNNLKILWQELDMYYEADWGEGSEHTKFMDHLNKERLYEFLAGLNRDLDEVRGRILGRTTLPTIGEAFAEVRREEKRRLIMLGDTRELKPVHSWAWCSHCNRVGHTKEKCFKLHGYPGKNQKENKATMISTTEKDAQDVRLTKTQLEALHKLLGTPTASGSLDIQGIGIGEDDWHS